MSSRVAKDFMSARPTTIGSTQTIFEAAKMMKDKSCGALPVFHEQDKTKIVGILTDRDIVVRVIAAGSDPKNIKVADVMSKELASVKENQQVADLVNLMSEKRVRRVLVQNDQGQFNGIVSLADLACKLEDKELLYKVTRGISEQSA